MDKQKTLDWLHDVSEQAMTEARGGNGALLHRIGSNPALSYYFNNVHANPAITPEQYAEQAPGFVQAADQFRVDYEAAAQIPEDHKRLNTVESELAAIKGQLTEVLAKLNESSGAKINAAFDARLGDTLAAAKTPAKPTGKAKKDEAAEDESEA